MEVMQSLAGPGRIRVTPGVALAPCPARAQPGAVLAQVVLMPLFPEQGSSWGRGLPEEGIIHFQECLNQRELLESSSSWMCSLSTGLLCPSGPGNPLASAPGAAWAAPG